MTREWKPGDVVTGEYGVGLVVKFNRLGCSGHHEAYPIHIHLSDGDWMCGDDVRPLVVIDPENEADLHRVMDALYAHGSKEFGVHLDWQAVQAALREFANPTSRPEEPKGLGAVVEATCRCITDQQRFVHEPQSDRFEGRPNGKGRPWKSACGHHLWSDLTAVHVLSEGVRP